MLDSSGFRSYSDRFRLNNRRISFRYFHYFGISSYRRSIACCTHFLGLPSSSLPAMLSASHRILDFVSVSFNVGGRANKVDGPTNLHLCLFMKTIPTCNNLPPTYPTPPKRKTIPCGGQSFNRKQYITDVIHAAALVLCRVT